MKVRIDDVTKSSNIYLLCLILVISTPSTICSGQTGMNTPKDRIKALDYRWSNYLAIQESELKDLMLINPHSSYLIAMAIYQRLMCEAQDIDDVESDFFRICNDPGNKIEETYYLLVHGLLTWCKGQKDYAMRAFQSSIDADKSYENKWSRLFLAHLYMEQLRDSVAEDLLNDALRIDSLFGQADILLSTIYFSRGDTTKAHTLVDKVLRRGESSQALLAKANLYFESEQYEMAQLYFEKVVSLDSCNATAYGCLGFIHQYYYKSYNTAINYYKSAQKHSVNDPVPLKRLGLVYLELKELQLSLEYWKLAFNLVQEQESFFRIVYLLIELKDYSKAQQMLDTQGNSFSKKETAFFMILLYTKIDKQKDAQKVIDKCYMELNKSEIEWINNELKAWGIIVK